MAKDKEYSPPRNYSVNKPAARIAGAGIEKRSAEKPPARVSNQTNPKKK